MLFFLCADEGTSLTPTPQDDANMVSFNLSWKKLTTFCAVMMGCTVLLVNRQNFGPSIRGGVASSLPSLGDEVKTCNLSFTKVGTWGMKDSGNEAEVKVHVMINGQWKYQDQREYHFSLDNGSTALGSTYQNMPISDTDRIVVYFEETDTFGSNDWTKTKPYGGMCSMRNCGQWGLECKPINNMDFRATWSDMWGRVYVHAQNDT